MLEACLERFYSRDGGAQEGMIIYRRSKEQVHLPFVHCQVSHSAGL